jgi:hypothetical protein
VLHTHDRFDWVAGTTPAAQNDDYEAGIIDMPWLLLLPRGGRGHMQHTRITHPHHTLHALGHGTAGA